MGKKKDTNTENIRGIHLGIEGMTLLLRKCYKAVA